MAIKGIAFDIDGTLYPSWQMFILSLPSFLLHPRLIWHFSRVRKAIRKVDVIENFRELQAKMIARSMKKSPETVFSWVETNLYGRWERSFRFLRPFPHVKNLLTELRARKDLKLGVLSDFPVKKKLSFLGLGDYWDVAFSSEEVNYLKPRPEPFLALAERMGLEPEEILYVGNDSRYDVEGAKSVGMMTALVDWRPSQGGADFVFSDYRKLREYLFFLI